MAAFVGDPRVMSLMHSFTELLDKPDDFDDTTCPICMDDFVFGGATDEERCIQLPCSHAFHPRCIKRMLETSGKCGICNKFYLVQIGNMPPGRMSVSRSSSSLPGFPRSTGTITISYSIQGGAQGPQHPFPGVPFSGTSRVAYLPDTPEGNAALRLLQICFDRKLTFTVGTSLTTGQPNCVVWNGVHHKTSTWGGAAHFGYPDDTYLERLFEELAAKGITRETTAS